MLRGLRWENVVKAIVQDAYGSAGVLRVGDIDIPHVEAEEVLVRVHAAGVDRGAWHLMTGVPYVMRAMGLGLRAPKHRVPGSNLAGVVERIGDKVAGFAPGDAVLRHRSRSVRGVRVSSRGPTCTET